MAVLDVIEDEPAIADFVITGDGAIFIQRDGGHSVPWLRPQELRKQLSCDGCGETVVERAKFHQDLESNSRSSRNGRETLREL